MKLPKKKSKRLIDRTGETQASKDFRARYKAQRDIGYHPTLNPRTFDYGRPRADGISYRKKKTEGTKDLWKKKK